MVPVAICPTSNLNDPWQGPLKGRKSSAEAECRLSGGMSATSHDRGCAKTFFANPERTRGLRNMDEIGSDARGAKSVDVDHPLGKANSEFLHSLHP
jgi:hypothetical protein